MNRLLRPTVQVTALNLASLGLGFAIQLIVAGLFGARSEMDAYLAASVVPTAATAILTGSFGFVLIPIFIQHRSSEGETAAWHFASAVLCFSAAILGALTIGGLLFRHPLLYAVVPGLDPTTLALATHLALFLWPTLFLSGLSSVLIALNQAEGRFVWQAFVPLVGSAAQLVVIEIGGATFGVQTFAMATVVGAALQLALLLSTVLRRGRFTFQGSFRRRPLIALARSAIPVTASRVLSDTAGVVDRYLASLLIVGSIARLNYATKISLLPLSLFSAAIAVTIFPLMSEAAARGDHARLRDIFSAGMRYTWLCYIPIVVLVCVLARPLVAIVFERGQFVHADTAVVGALLPWYMVSMSARALGNISSRMLYALDRARLMSALNVFSIAFYVVTVFPLAHWLGIVGIPIATTLCDWLLYLIQSFVIWLDTGRQVERRLLSGIARISAAALVGGVAAWFGQRWLGPTDLVRVVGSGVVGLLAYAGVLIIVRAPEVRAVQGWLAEWSLSD